MSDQHQFLVIPNGLELCWSYRTGGARQALNANSLPGDRWQDRYPTG